MGIALNLHIALGNMAILIYLSFQPINMEYRSHLRDRRYGESNSESLEIALRSGWHV